MSLARTMALTAGLVLIACSRPAPSDTSAKTSTVGTASPEAELEKRLSDLALEVDQKKRAHAWDECEAVLRRMMALDPDHPKAWVQAVFLEKEKGKIEEAAAFLDRLGPRDGPGRLYADGVLCFFQGRPAEGPKPVQQALRLYQTRNHLAGQAACHTALGNFARAAEDKAAALREFSMARGFLERIEDRPGLMDIAGNMAELELAAHQPQQALDDYKITLVIRHANGDRRGEGKSLFGMGCSLIALGKRKEGLDCLQQALSLRRETRDWDGEIHTLQEIASAYQDARDFEAALLYRGLALSTARRKADKPVIATQLWGLSDTLSAAGRVREAVAPLESASALYKESGQQIPYLRARAALGQTLITLGEMRRARAELEPTLEMARAAHDRAGLATVLTHLGNLDMANGDLVHALVSQQEALEIHRELRDDANELVGLNNIGAIDFDLGHRARSRSYMEDALAAAKKLGDRKAEAQASNNLGVLLADDRGYQPALEQFQRSSGMWDELHDSPRASMARKNAAEALLHLGRTEEAAKVLDTALEGMRRAGDVLGEAHALNLLGEIRSKSGDRTGARSAHLQALRLAEETGLPDETWSAHAGLASLLVTDGHRAEALDHLSKALDALDQVRSGLVTGDLKMRFVSREIDLYDQMLASLLPDGSGFVQKGMLASAFRTVERSRARSLVDTLAASSPQRPASAEARRGELEALDEVGEGLARLSRAATSEERTTARRQVDASRERIEHRLITDGARDPRRSSAAGAATVPLEAIERRALKTGEVLLEYFIGKEQAWVFQIEKGRASVLPLPTPAKIASLTSAFLDTVTGSGSGPHQDGLDLTAAKELADAILPPHLPSGVRRLLIAPDGPLHHVPFEALRRDDRFLVESYEVGVVPSATALDLLRRLPGTRSGGDFLGVANPTLPERDERFPPLPYSENEVESIAGLFPRNELCILKGADATREKIRGLDLERFRFLHFATHGWLDGKDALESGLVLSAPHPEGPHELLTVDDILSLRLHSDLVVLSACRSGAGEQLEGEGLIGLTRAFLHAGSRAVVMSLWDITDQATVELMRDFYDGMLRGKSASSALREAKLRFLRSPIGGRRRIVRWAPYVLVGDPGDPPRS